MRSFGIGYGDKVDLVVGQLLQPISIESEPYILEQFVGGRVVDVNGLSGLHVLNAESNKRIDSTLVIADELRGGVLELEEEQLTSVPLGHTDTDRTTRLHVPSIGLAPCGDVLYALKSGT